MYSQDFARYFITVSNFGVLNFGELKSYLNDRFSVDPAIPLKQSLINKPQD